VAAVRRGEAVEGYAVDLVRATREHEGVALGALGASPRATLALCRAAQALAALHGCAYVLPDDVKRLAPAALGHRIVGSSVARLRGATADTVVVDVLASVPVPVEEAI